MFKQISSLYFLIVCIAFPPLFLVYVPVMVVTLSRAASRRRYERYVLGVYHAHTMQAQRDKLLLSFR